MCRKSDSFLPLQWNKTFMMGRDKYQGKKNVLKAKL